MYYWINSFSEWQYSTKYEENWNRPEYSVDWSKSKLSDIKVDKDILYLRIEHSRPDNFDDYTSFYSRMKVLSGIKYYINGEEIFKYFIDEERDTSSDKFSELQNMRFIFPITSMEDEEIVIGIELHREESETNFPSFEYIGFALEGDDKYDCTSLNSFGYEILDYSPKNSDSDPSEVLKESGSIWRGSNDYKDPIYFTYKFGDFSYFFENTFEYHGFNQGELEMVDINNISSTFDESISESNAKEISYTMSSLYIQNKVNFGLGTSFLVTRFELSICRIFECEKGYLTNSEKSFKCGESPDFVISSITCQFGKEPHFDGVFQCQDAEDKMNYKLDNYTFYLGEEGEYVELFELHIPSSIGVTPCITIKSYFIL